MSETISEPPEPTGTLLPPEADITTWQAVRRIARDYLKPFALLIFFALLANSVVAAATGAVPWLIKQAVDRVFGAQDPRMLVLVPLAAIVVMFIKALATYGSDVIMSTIGQRIVSAIQVGLFARIVRADLAWITNTHSGRFISTFMMDAVRLRDTVTTSIVNLTQNLLTVFALVVAMFYTDWQLAILGSSIMPVAAFFMRKLGRKTRRAARKGLEGSGDLSAIISETLGGIRVVKAYGQEEREIERAKSTINQVLSHAMRAIRARAAASPMTEALSGFGIAGVIYYGGLQVQGGHLTLGDLTGFLSAMMLAYQPLKAVANTQTVMQEGIAAAGRLFPILDVVPNVVSPADGKVLKITDGAISFNDVSFRYADGTLALGHVTVKVPRGHTVALVGPSGAGKSTMLNLVPRFYDVAGGSVTIDGQDVRAVTLASLREASALVTQEPFLFDDTVRANIAYGRPDASQSDIEEAARNAAAHDFIMALPRAYDTRVGEAGMKLSGGQRQRIAIARAMLKDAPILLLDEATSALDTASELQVQQALATLMKGRTTLVIAHRLSTIMHADRIYVIDAGTVLEEGRHDELVAMGGLYAELYNSQFGKNEPLPDAPILADAEKLGAGE
ncbi:MAG: ABC transporter ATP-binding protein [Parvibaculaceae bacterium]|nr:ABC transporter ATP-binding protein [Parvibaculaceae bacterium]